jgi:hypothetical protein
MVEELKRKSESQLVRNKTVYFDPNRNMIGDMAKPAAKKGMSAAHKAALATGRVEGRVVREYLEALRANKPKRGRKRTAETVKSQLAALEAEIAEADPVRELQLVQRRMDLQEELAAMKAKVNMKSLETAFVKIAKSYSARNGITYAAWREIGVEPSVLKAAGIGRGAN